MFGNTVLAGASTMKLALGFSLCTLGGAMLYIYFSQQDDDDDSRDGNGNKSKNNNNKVTPQKEIKAQIIVSNQHVPLILGRNGTNLISIEEKTQTKIHFSDKDISSKFCQIVGLTSNVNDAYKMIMKEIDRTTIVKEEMSLPLNCSGRNMSRFNEAIPEICRQSLAKISKLENGKITITGNRSQVNLAIKLLEEKIEEDKDFQRTLEETEQRRDRRRSPSASLNSSQTSLATQIPSDEKLTSTFQNDDKYLDVYVSAIASPSKFWIQLIGPQTKKLDEMVEEMTNYYEVEENRANHVIKEPYLGQIVTAAFKLDGKWYRAEIVGILPNQYNPQEVVLDLYFVDYGDSEYVAPHEVYELRTDFLTLRFQAVECFLANLRSNTKHEAYWDPQAIEKFEELTQVANWKKLVARVVTYKDGKATKEDDNQNDKRSLEIPGVELFDVIEGVHVNLGHMLISHGYALPIETNEEDSDAPTSSRSTSTIQSTVTEQSYHSAKDVPGEQSVEDMHFDAQLQYLRKNNLKNVDTNYLKNVTMSSELLNETDNSVNISR